MPRPAHSPPRGTTLLELLLVVTILGILSGLAVPSFRGAADRQAARAAAREVALLLAAARQIAATTLGGAAVHFDSATATVRVVATGTAIRTVPLGTRHRVRLRATRDSLAYDGRGVGIGAANLSVILSVGAAAETVVVSRLGRLRGGL